MRLISPPGDRLTEVAGQLLESAHLLGLAPGVVETTTGAEFGYGFTVPDDVFEHWFLRRGEARGAAPVPVEPQGPVTPLESEFPAPEAPGAPGDKPRRRRGVAATTQEEA